MVMVGFHFKDLVDFIDLDDKLLAMLLKCDQNMPIMEKLVL